MSRFIATVLFGCAFLVVLPTCARAQYDCPVSIHLDKKVVLRTSIVEAKRPSTDRLWRMLDSLLFTGTIDETDSEGGGVLKGKVRVAINGAGSVELDELHLVRHTKGGKQWVIAPDDLERILTLRGVTKE